MKCKVRLTREEAILDWMMQTTPEGAYLAADGGVDEEYSEEIICVVDDNSVVDYVIKE